MNLMKVDGYQTKIDYAPTVSKVVRLVRTVNQGANRRP